MRLPRLRITVRRTMIAVASVAILMWGVKQVPLRAWASHHWNCSSALLPFCHNARRNTPEELRLIRYHDIMETIYSRLADIVGEPMIESKFGFPKLAQ